MGWWVELGSGIGEEWVVGEWHEKYFLGVAPVCHVAVVQWAHMYHCLKGPMQTDEGNTGILHVLFLYLSLFTINTRAGRYG